MKNLSIHNTPGKKCLVLPFIFIIGIFLSACGNQATNVQKDLISQKKVDDSKIQLTIMVKYAFSINEFEKAAEEKFPELDIVQVGNYTSDRGIAEYARRMEHDDLTDIVMTWPLDVAQEYWEDRLIDLSGMPFTGNYHISMLDKISENGKLYYLPGPSQVRGIVYNKTLFEEKGWEVPTDFNGFVELCQKIEKSGMRSLQLGFSNEEVLDTAFVGYSYGDCFSKPQDAEWLHDYNMGKGSIKDQFRVGLDTFQTMIDAGIWKPDDLNVDYAKREEMFFTRQCAMVEDSVLMARMGFEQTGSTDEFALMPFFSKEDNSDWARLYMVCYIGMNKHLLETENKEKYEMALKLMEYISTIEGQEALAADTGAMYSSVKNMQPPNIVEIENLIKALDGGRYAIFPELKNSQAALRAGLKGMLQGTLTKEDVVTMVDEQNKKPSAKEEVPVLGEATEDFTFVETGNFVTDAMREKAGTDIALFLDNGMDGRYNGKGISGKIYKGVQKSTDVKCVFPDLKHNEKGILQKITMSGKDLITTLEYAVTVDNNNNGWFYYFSGLKMKFSPFDEPGSRIKKITDSNDKAIDEDKIYSIAIMDETVPEELIQSTEDTDIKILDLLADTISQKKKISPANDNRFVIVK